MKVLKLLPLIILTYAISGCGGGSSSGEEPIELSEFVIPSESMTYTVEEFFFTEDIGGPDGSFTVQDEIIDGRLVSTNSISDDMVITEIVGDEIVITEIADDSIAGIDDLVIRWPTQVRVGQLVENSIEIFGVEFTISFTFQVLPSFAISTPDQTFTTFNDVLQVETEITSPSVEGEDRSTIYFARGLGEIGSIDIDCEDIDGVIMDASTDCDDIDTEFYSVRVN